jgi:hypothetical protein
MQHARIGPALQWRRREVHHTLSHARQTMQGFLVIQIPGQWTDTVAAQRGCTFCIGGQCQMPHGRTGLPHHAYTNVTTADDQHTLAAKTARQCA